MKTLSDTAMYKIYFVTCFLFIFFYLSSELQAESSLPYNFDINQKTGEIKFSTGMIKSSGFFKVKVAGKNGIQEISLKDFIETRRTGNSLTDSSAMDIYSEVDNAHDLGFELIIRNYLTMNGFSFQIKMNLTGSHIIKRLVRSFVVIKFDVSAY